MRHTHATGESKMSKDKMAGQVAETVVEDLKALIKHSQFRPRIWLASDHARIYTGSRNEYLSVYRDGRIERSQTNMSWGREIEEATQDRA